ncbi:MAG: hypothetical protein COA71_12760, partial [SAR86 cluster bacterium]
DSEGILIWAISALWNLKGSMPLNKLVRYFGGSSVPDYSAIVITVAVQEVACIKDAGAEKEFLL